MPPVVSKQGPQGNPKPSGNVLDRIREVRVKETAIKLNVYGEGKTGKTRFACTFPKPILLIGSEDGTKSVATIKDVFFVRIESSAEFRELVEYAKGGKYKTVVLDTAGGLQDLIIKEELMLPDVPVQKSYGMLDRDGWIPINAATKECLDKFLNLADKFDINTIVIAHERAFNEDKSNPLVTTKISSALSPGVARYLDTAVDYLCQTYKEEEVQTITEDDGLGGKITVNKRTGKTLYWLRTGPHSVYRTGFRVPPEVALPDRIKPKYEEVVDLIKGITPAVQKPVAVRPPVPKPAPVKKP